MIGVIYIMVVHKGFLIIPDEPITRALSDTLYHILPVVTVRILYSYSPTSCSNKNINTIIITTPFIEWCSEGPSGYEWDSNNSPFYRFFAVSSSTRFSKFVLQKFLQIFFLILKCSFSFLGKVL